MSCGGEGGGGGGGGGGTDNKSSKRSHYQLLETPLTNFSFNLVHHLVSADGDGWAPPGGSLWGCKH